MQVKYEECYSCPYTLSAVALQLAFGKLADQLVRERLAIDTGRVNS